MATDSANSERERLEEICKVCKKPVSVHNLASGREVQVWFSALEHAWHEDAELTSLRACVSRKDEEIAGLRDLIRRWTGTEPEDLFAAEAIQPSGRCAEGREEDNARNL